MDDDAPMIPLGDLKTIPAFYSALALCQREEPFFLCGFHDAGGPYTPSACLGKFRSAGEGWNETTESGEDIYVTDDPACGLINVKVVRRIRGGGTMTFSIEFKGKPD
jgi:hypothetical protein